MQLPTGFDYHYFDDPNADGYRGYHPDKWVGVATPPWEFVATFCCGQGIASAIDVGCAKGFLVEALLANGINAVGFDISDYALAFAKQLPCFKRDIRDGIPGRWDALIALGILLYVNEEELGKILCEINRATNKLFLFSTHYEGDRQVIPDPLRRITRTRAWWQTLIESAGFQLLMKEAYFDVYTKSKIS